MATSKLRSILIFFITLYSPRLIFSLPRDFTFSILWSNSISKLEIIKTQRYKNAFTNLLSSNVSGNIIRRRRTL